MGTTTRAEAVAAPRLLSIFSGIGGIELGFEQAGVQHSTRFCEIWPSAQSVLKGQFPDTPISSDVTTIEALDDAVAIVTAGFPCTDISQAGRTKGLDGSASGLVFHVLELLKDSNPDWVLLENVPNLLTLGGGSAIRAITDMLDDAGYSWAYRVIDSRSMGLAQRRRRVYLLASRTHDPARVLFRADAGATSELDGRKSDAFGFSWTEGNRGVGWCQDGVPTLRGSTTASIPSAPAVWVPSAPLGSQIVTPTIQAVETLQGFPVDWTSAAPERDRWKLVGNAVSPPIAKWIAEGIVNYEDLMPVNSKFDVKELGTQGGWPGAGYCDKGGAHAIAVSEWPLAPGAGRDHLLDILNAHGSVPLSLRATDGFRRRLAASSLKYLPEFMAALEAHVEFMTQAALAKEDRPTETPTELVAA